VGITSSRKVSATRQTLNQVSIAAVLDRDSNAAQRAHRPKSVTSDISALPAQRRCAALATTAGPQATEITQA